eukprot:scaffold5768_cov59-Attheya_sp.AAC.1
MAFLKLTPLTFTRIPRLPEDTVQVFTSSQVVLERLLGILLGSCRGKLGHTLLLMIGADNVFKCYVEYGW